MVTTVILIVIVHQEVTAEAGHKFKLSFQPTRLTLYRKVLEIALKQVTLLIDLLLKQTVTL